MKQSPARIVWIDYLRSFITVLVIAHHAALAYTTFSTFNKPAYILSTHPVVDAARFVGLDFLVGFNDVYFMALMFLISGVFLVKGLQRKGATTFVHDRFYRLFIPFLIAVTILMPLAYYPAYLLSDKTPGLMPFLKDFFTVEGWPVGPPWFVWVLFLFSLVVALFHKIVMPWLIRVGIFLQSIRHRPLLVLLLLIVFCWILYVPVLLYVGPYAWTGIGPFDFQESRLLLYFGFFLLGGAIGVPAWEEGLFAAGGALVKRWWMWLMGAIVFYVLLVACMIVLPQDQMIMGTCFTIAMVFSCLAALCAFRRFATRVMPAWDALAANAYGMYLLHYVFVTWLQYALLDFALPAFMKFEIVFLFATVSSFYATRGLRKIPVLAQWL